MKIPAFAQIALAQNRKFLALNKKPWPGETSGDPKTLFDQATTLYCADHFHEAIPKFEEYLRTPSERRAGNAQFGICLGQVGRLQESIPDVQKRSRSNRPTTNRATSAGFTKN